MEKVTLLLSTISISVLLQGCMPGTGADAAMMNGTRGSKNAQISKAQARQYSRQQRLSADEIRLQNMKRRQSTDAVREGSDAVHDGLGAIRDIRSLFGKY